MSKDNGASVPDQALVQAPSPDGLGPTGFDPSRGVCLLPVIHYADDDQVMRNAERAIEAGCDGVMLIEMRGRNHGLLFAGAMIKRRWPFVHVGINHLSTETERAVHNSISARADSTWTDEQLTHSSGAADWDARRVARLLRSTRPHLLFCAVAFKYQAHEPEPARAARLAVDLGFIPTTSGHSTGVAADPAHVEAMRELLKPGEPLAIASGITPDNAALFLPLVSHVLVSTGVSASFHEFDPTLLKALVAVRDAAQGMSTRSAETEGLSPQDASPVGSADAPKAKSPDPRDDGEK